MKKIPKKTPRFSLLYQLRTFVFAFNGIKQFFSFETKAVIHLFFSFLAILLGIIVHLDKLEWVMVTLTIGIVFLAEIVNTAIEKIVDHISPEQSDVARSVKDLSAAAVLVASLAALAVGILLFGPKIIHLIKCL